MHRVFQNEGTGSWDPEFGMCSRISENCLNVWSRVSKQWRWDVIGRCRPCFCLRGLPSHFVQERSLQVFCCTLIDKSYSQILMLRLLWKTGRCAELKVPFPLPLQGRGFDQSTGMLVLKVALSEPRAFFSFSVPLFCMYSSVSSSIRPSELYTMIKDTTTLWWLGCKSFSMGLV